MSYKENLEFRPQSEIRCLICSDKRVLEMVGNQRAQPEQPEDSAFGCRIPPLLVLRGPSQWALGFQPR